MDNLSKQSLFDHSLGYPQRKICDHLRWTVWFYWKERLLKIMELFFLFIGNLFDRSWKWKMSLYQQEDQYCFRLQGNWKKRRISSQWRMGELKRNYSIKQMGTPLNSRKKFQSADEIKLSIANKGCSSKDLQRKKCSKEVKSRERRFKNYKFFRRGFVNQKISSQ